MAKWVALALQKTERTSIHNSKTGGEQLKHFSTANWFMRHQNCPFKRLCRLCQVLHVSREAFYWEKSQPEPSSVVIFSIFLSLFNNYGDKLWSRNKGESSINCNADSLPSCHGANFCALLLQRSPSVLRALGNWRHEAIKIRLCAHDAVNMQKSIDD